MSNTTRIEYLNKNRKKGDCQAISEQLSLNYSTVYDIVCGKFLGEHGEKVLTLLEEIIEKRIKKEKRLSNIYNKKLKNSL